MKRFFLAAALMLITASSAFAQIGGGTLSGTVTDEQGGVLPGVDGHDHRHATAPGHARRPMKPASSGSSTWRPARTRSR